jgi:hypothetical protein
MRGTLFNRLGSWSNTSAMPPQDGAPSALSTHGQRHDRNHHEALTLGEPEEDDGDMPISLGQKMLAATLGSLITSLLGKFWHIKYGFDQR